MTPLTSKTVYLFLALTALPHVLAGPACAHRNYGNSDCLTKCKDRWGYQGHYMGRNRWGSVISSSTDQNTDQDSVLSTACGLDKTSTSDPASTPTDPPYDDPSSSSSSKPSHSDSGYIPVPSVSRSGIPPDSSSSSSFSRSSSTSSTTTTSSTPSSTSTPPPPSRIPPTSTPPPSQSPSPPLRVNSFSFSSSSKASSPPPQPSPTSNSPIEGADSVKDESLTGHNSFRALHGASPLTWNEDLVTAAKTWVSKCVFEHSGGQVGDYGENLAAGTGNFSVTDGINLWTGEAKDYDPQNPQYSHFTQVVWKATTEVGCSIVTCPPGTIFKGTNVDAQFYACEYSPPGNVVGQFAENVQV